MTTAWACEAVAVTVRFGGVQALDAATLRAAPGEVTGLIGANGAGKSTLFDVLAGVTRPEGGQVLLGGADVTARSALWRARHGVRRTFQRQQAFGSLTVADNVRAALEWRRGRAADRRVDAVLELCGLGELRTTTTGRLGIGGLRMVELARAIADPPTVLLLDEPTSGVDEGEKERLRAVMTAMRTEFQCAVVLVEHDVPFVMGTCSRVVVLHLGRTIADGTPDEVQNDEKVLDAYLR